MAEFNAENIATEVCRTVAELPDRNSPEDWPEAMLVTADELRSIVLAAIATNADEDAWVIDRLSTLLAGVAIALKGEERPRHRHGFHDLPDVAQALKLELDIYRASFPNGVPESATAGDALPAAKVVSKHGDPEAFGEREIKVLADLQKLPYGTKLYAHPPAAVHGQSASTEGTNCCFDGSPRCTDEAGARSNYCGCAQAEQEIEARDRAAWAKLAAKAHGWADNSTPPMIDGRFETGWHEAEFQAFMQGVRYGRS